MADGRRHIYQGKRLIASGRRATGDACCCSSQPCAYCTGTTPYRFNVTVSGIQLCTGCYLQPALQQKWTALPNVPSGTFSAVQMTGVPCRYRYQEDIAQQGDWQWYTGENCETPDPWQHHWTHLFRVEVIIESGKLVVVVYYRCSMTYSPPDTGYESYARNFYGELSLTNPCEGGTVNNSLTCGFDYGDGNDWMRAGYGGTAVVVAA
jgi:hypothetical protein